MSFNNRSVKVHQFSMVPSPDVPRAAFNLEFMHKTTFDAGVLVPVLCEEVLPGDSMNCSMTAFARLATPIFPLMDNLHIDTFFFFVPNRLVWASWVNFMGEREDPNSSTDFLVPQLVSDAGGFPVNSLFDYFGLPTVGQVDAGGTVAVNALPLRGYNLIFNEWFRDQNMQQSTTVRRADSGDLVGDFALQRRAKRADYFTTALPWPQKGEAVTLPFLPEAPVVTQAIPHNVGTPLVPMTFRRSDTGGVPTAGRSVGLSGLDPQGGGRYLYGTTAVETASSESLYPTNLFADLSEATAVTINQFRQAFQIQKLLERDARGGTRYVEIVQAHFRVRSPDARLQRPEYLGGGSSPMSITPVAQQSATGVTGGSTPLGSLSAIGTGVARHGFSGSFVEHGYVIGLVNIRSDITYQQGLRRHWSRQTRYDYYFPAFAMLGEQAVLRKEIYCKGLATDENVFGYQERWAEYRYSPSMITGLFRSTSAGTLDAWHLAQNFATAPVLGGTFIQDNPPLSRILAVGAAANGAQIIFDSVFKIRAARPLPLFSVPGMLDHF